MENTLLWMAENAMWLWVGGGLVLLAGEMILPGVYLLWLGLSAMLTGFVMWFAPDISFAAQCIVFAIFGTASIYIANRFFYNRSSELEEADTVNIRGRKHIGKQYEVIQAIQNGRGKVKVGDSQWLAEGDNADVGDWVEVVDIEGSVLKVAHKG